VREAGLVGETGRTDAAFPAPFSAAKDGTTGLAGPAHPVGLVGRWRELVADTRARWKAKRVVVVDFGDRVVMRPLPDDPVDDLEGKYRARGPAADEARRRARREESARASSR
jgi:hypothetical protein